MNYINPVDNNRSQLESKARKKSYPLDSIWQRGSGEFCHKTLAGTVNQFATEKEARRSKKNWRPYTSRLVRDGIIQKGDTLLLKLSGTPRAFELQIEGVRGKSLLFSVGGEVYSMGEIRKLVAKQLNKNPVSLHLNDNQTIHQPSGKTLQRMKTDYISEVRGQTVSFKKPSEPLDFLNIIGLSAAAEAEQTKEKEAEYITNFRDDLKRYEDAQFNILSTLQTLSKEVKMDCYRDSLIMFLGNTKTHKIIG